MLLLNPTSLPSRAALEAAGRDAVVLALADLMNVAGRLPGAWGDRAWDALVWAQDLRFASVMQWHDYVAGCRGRRP